MLRVPPLSTVAPHAQRLVSLRLLQPLVHRNSSPDVQLCHHRRMTRRSANLAPPASSVPKTNPQSIPTGTTTQATSTAPMHKDRKEQWPPTWKGRRRNNDALLDEGMSRKIRRCVMLEPNSKQIIFEVVVVVATPRAVVPGSSPRSGTASDHSRFRALTCYGKVVLETIWHVRHCWYALSGQPQTSNLILQKVQRPSHLP